MDARYVQQPAPCIRPVVCTVYPTRHLTHDAHGAEGGVLNLSIVKGSKGTTWESLLAGHTKNDPYTASEVQKTLMLERFQAENPGFDFSGASFNGSVPDPKTFMGGVGYNTPR